MSSTSAEPRAQIPDAARSKLNVALDDAAKELLDVLYTATSASTGASGIFSKFSGEEMLRLSQGHRRALAALFDPLKTDDELVAEARKIGFAHSMAGVRTSDTMNLVSGFGELFHRRALELGLDHDDSEDLISVLRHRLALMMRSSVAEMERLDDSLAARLDALSENLGGASTQADLIERCLELVNGLEGVVAVGLGRVEGANRVLLEFHQGMGQDVALAVDCDESGDEPWMRALMSGEVEVRDAIDDHPGSDILHEALIGMGARSFAAVPMIKPDAGSARVLAILSDWTGFFSAGPRRRFLAFLQQAMTGAVASLERRESMALSRSAAFRAMIRTGALEMHYQPIVELRTGRVAKMEALARLRHGDGSLITPGEFLPALGADDLLALFERGLQISLGDMAEWEQADFACSLSFNLPTQGLRDRRYLEVLRRCLADSGFAPHRLTLELTEEEHLGEAGDHGEEIFWAMRELGVAFAQDDLGSGYSSLLRLEKFGFEDVKIDQQLVRGANNPHNLLGLIQHLTRLAHDLRMRVVVEGLEDASLIEAASVLGADYGQGFGIAKPMPAAEVMGWLGGFNLESSVAAPRTSLGAMAALRRWSAQLSEIGRYAENVDMTAPIHALRGLVSALPADSHQGARDRFGLGRAEGDEGANLLARELSAALEVLSELGQREIGPERGPLLGSLEEATLPSASFSPLQLGEILGLQNGILRSMAAGLEARPLLDEVCLAAEATLPNSVASVMSVAEGKLHLVAGPSLGSRARETLAVMEVIPGGGSCPNAVLSCAPVYVNDTSTDPRWRDVVMEAVDLGLSACWSTPIFDYRGEVIGTFALSSFESRNPGEFHRNLLEICSNLTSVILERDRVERELSLRSERLEHMFEGNQALKFIIDADTGEMLEANRSALEFYGYSSGQLAELTVFDFNVDLTPGGLAEIARAASEEGGYHARVRHVRSDGEIRYMDLHTHLYSEAGRRIFLSIVHDVTEQERAQQELKRERLLGEAILNSLPGYVVVVDRRGRIVRFNERAQEVTGLTFEEASSDIESWRRWSEPEDTEIIKQSFRTLMDGGYVPGRDFWQTSTDGERRLMRMTYAPVLAEDGTVDLVAILGSDVTAEHMAAKVISWERDFSSSVMDSIPQPVVVLDSKMRRLRFNRAMEELEAATDSSSTPRGPLEAILDPEVYERAHAWLEEMVQGAEPRSFLGPIQTEGGDSHIYEWSCVVLEGEHFSGPTFVLTGSDITSRLRESRELAQAAVFFDVSLEAIAVTDFEGKVLRSNPAFHRITGYSPEESLGMETMSQAMELNPAELFEDVTASLAESGSWSGTMWNHRKSGEAFPALMHISLFNASESDEPQIMTVFSDISAMVDYQQELVELAYHDQLTKLPNRAQLTERLEHALARERRGDHMLGLVYLDLDDFKLVNDTYGHAGGDRMLISVAKSLSSVLRRSDCVARIGGDEFVCLLDSIESEADARATLARLAGAIEAPVVVGEDGSTASSTASMGLVLSTGAKGTDADALLRLADHLMYEAKRAGGNGFLIEQV